MPKIQMRRDTAANWKSVNPVLLSGEWALETDTRKMKIGDGVTPYNTLEYFREDDNEWVKPDDWLDIRSGALSNSVYFLVGHSADYTKYGSWGLRVRVSSSGTYDVYVDGVKQATTASNTVTTLNWQTLNLATGYDVTYPEALRTHIVRITPTTSTNTLTEFIQLTNDGIGTLWAHFTTDTVGIYGFTGGVDSVVTFPVLEAVTTNTGTKSIAPYGSATGAFRYCTALIETPIFTGSENNIGMGSMFLGCTKLKKIKLENIKNDYASTLFQGCTSLEKIEAKNVIVNPRYAFARECSSLEDFGNISFDFSNYTTFQDMFTGCTKLKPFVLDMSEGTSATRATIGGTSTARIDGLKGLIVSNEAPFNGSSPQIDVSYTGMERSALVALFNSLPTVSNGQTINVAGCLGTADLTLADIQIATDKGWNVDGIDTPASNSLPYTLPVEFQQ